MPCGEGSPIIGMWRFIGPEGGDKEKFGGRAIGGRIPVVDPCYLAVGENLEGGGGGIVG